MEAVDRAYLDAVHVLALDAVFGDDESHSISQARRNPNIVPRAARRA
jgi:hypothetical protein